MTFKGGPASRPLLLILAVALCVAGCTPSGPPPDRADSAAAARLDPTVLRGSNALARVAAFVALGPRDSNTPGARRAAAYLADELAAMYAPLVATGLEHEVGQNSGMVVTRPAR